MLGTYSQTFYPGKTIQQSVQNIPSGWAMEFFGPFPSLKITDVIYLTLKKFFFFYDQVMCCLLKKADGKSWCCYRIMMVSPLEEPT